MSEREKNECTEACHVPEKISNLYRPNVPREGKIGEGDLWTRIHG
jgi:hypothetical protein